MLKMSFYNNTLDRKKLIDLINKTNKPILYTYGLRYKNPTTLDKEISKDKAIQIANDQLMLEASEKENAIYLTALSSNDMF